MIVEGARSKISTDINNFCRDPSPGTPSAAITGPLELLSLCRYLNPGS